LSAASFRPTPSLGLPEDFEEANHRRLLINAIFWSADRQRQNNTKRILHLLQDMKEKPHE